MERLSWIWWLPVGAYQFVGNMFEEPKSCIRRDSKRTFASLQGRFQLNVMLLTANIKTGAWSSPCYWQHITRRVAGLNRPRQDVNISQALYSITIKKILISPVNTYQIANPSDDNIEVDLPAISMSPDRHISCLLTLDGTNSHTIVAWYHRVSQIHLSWIISSSGKRWQDETLVQMRIHFASILRSTAETETCMTVGTCTCITTWRLGMLYHEMRDCWSRFEDAEQCLALRAKMERLARFSWARIAKDDVTVYLSGRKYVGALLFLAYAVSITIPVDRSRKITSASFSGRLLDDLWRISLMMSL